VAPAALLQRLSQSELLKQTNQAEWGVPRPAGIVSIASFAALICASIRNQLAFLAKADRACEGKVWSFAARS
jgi:hypothetical protein